MLFPESTGGRKHSRTVGAKSGTSNGENGILLGFRSVCGTELAMPDLEIPENGFVLMETGGSFRALKSTPPSLLMRENPYPCEKKNPSFVNPICMLAHASYWFSGCKNTRDPNVGPFFFIRGAVAVNR